MVLLVVAALSGVAGPIYQTQATGQDDKKPTAEKPAKPAAEQEKEKAKDKDKEIVTAWGEEMAACKRAWAFVLASKGSATRGEWLRSSSGPQRSMRRWRSSIVRNLTGPDFPKWRTPGQTDCLKKGFLPNFCSSKKVNLAPGKSIELWQWKLNLRPRKRKYQTPAR